MKNPEAFYTQSEQNITLRQRLQSVFAKYPDIQAAYLFGSVAAGTQRRDSDLDLALLPRSGKLRRQKLNILTDLAQAGFDNADLIILDTADLVLQYEAVRLNQLIYHAAEFNALAFYSKVVRQYLDFLPYLEVQRAAYKRRILNG